MHRRESRASGQSTVEYAVIFAGFMALIVALSAMGRAFGSGLLVEHALSSASHHLQLAALGAASDIFLY